MAMHQQQLPASASQPQSQPLPSPVSVSVAAEDVFWREDVGGVEGGVHAPRPEQGAVKWWEGERGLVAREVARAKGEITTPVVPVPVSVRAHPDTDTDTAPFLELSGEEQYPQQHGGLEEKGLTTTTSTAREEEEEEEGQHTTTINHAALPSTHSTAQSEFATIADPPLSADACAEKDVPAPPSYHHHDPAGLARRGRARAPTTTTTTTTTARPSQHQARVSSSSEGYVEHKEEEERERGMERERRRERSLSVDRASQFVRVDGRRMSLPVHPTAGFRQVSQLRSGGGDDTGSSAEGDGAGGFMRVGDLVRARRRAEVVEWMTRGSNAANGRPHSHSQSSPRRTRLPLPAHNNIARSILEAKHNNGAQHLPAPPLPHPPVDTRMRRARPHPCIPPSPSTRKQPAAPGAREKVDGEGEGDWTQPCPNPTMGALTRAPRAPPPGLLRSTTTKRRRREGRVCIRSALLGVGKNRARPGAGGALKESPAAQRLNLCPGAGESMGRRRRRTEGESEERALGGNHHRE